MWGLYHNKIMLEFFNDGIDIQFILDESAFQGLSIGILFFSFCRVVQKLLKKEN